MEPYEYLSELLELPQDSRVEQLEAEIEYLLRNNQERLLWILYRLDVGEQKLKWALAEATEQEEKVVTQLLLERCAQIVQTRKQFGATTQTETPDWSFDLE